MWNKKDLEKIFNRGLEIGNNLKGIKIDSRLQGDIFIGIKGPNHDGSNFSKQAIENGAKLCIVSNIPSDCSDQPEKFIVLNDTYNDGLLKIAQFNRDHKHKNNSFIGVTGSVGKTTTKEMLKIAFSALLDDAYANDGNLNNHYGLPLSLANMSDAKCSIFELGMSSAGEISFLSKILKPHISIITGIAPAHMESFSGLDQIAAAKAEIVDGMEENGILILNLDSPHADVIIEHAKKHSIKIFGYSLYENDLKVDLKIVLENQQTTPPGQTLMSVKFNEKRIDYRIGEIGSEFLLNSMAVLGALIAYSDGDLESIKKGMNGLESFSGLKGRGKKTFFPQKQITLIDDSYNANPTSVKAAIERFARISNGISSDSKRSVAVLGDMLELGNDEIEMHKNLIDIISKNNIDKVFCVGNRMYELFKILPKDKQGLWCETAEEMSITIKDLLCDGDCIMVKGSNSMRMSRVCSAIEEHCRQITL